MTTRAGAAPVELDVRNPPSVRRPVAAGLTVLLAFAASLVAARGFQTWRLNEGLVEDIGRYRARAWDRSALVDRALPGTFGERLGPVLEERLQVDTRALQLELPHDCVLAFTRLRFGLELGPMPAHCFAAAEARLPLARRFLAATYAERGGPLTTEWRTPLDGRAPSSDQFSAVTGVTMVAALHRMQEQRYAEALVLCRDLLALGRDVALTSGTAAVWTQTGTLYSVGLVCADALGRADARTRRELLRAMQRLRSVRPSFATAVELDSLKQRLGFFSELLTPGQRSRLADPPLPFPQWRVSDRSILPLRWLAMPALMRFETRRVAAASGALASYSARLGELQRELEGHWNPFIENALGRLPSEAEGTIALYAACDAKVDLLVAALEVSLDPTRLWEVSAAGAPVRLGFDDGGRVRFSVANPRVSPLVLEAPLIPVLAGPAEPGALLFSSR